MKILIAITSCHAYRDRAIACRETWANNVAGADVRFFFGRQAGDPVKPLPDEVFLDCPDDYRNFPLKVQAMRKWAYENGYELVYKADDDSYVRPERLLQALPQEGYHYVGRVRGCSGHYPASYCSGFGYWLSRFAISKLLLTEWNGDVAEDRFTGNALFNWGILPRHEARLTVTWSKNNALSGREAPLKGNCVIASCEFGPNKMREIHNNFVNGIKSQVSAGPITEGRLSDVNIMIKTFLRDGYMFAAVKGLLKNFSECRLIIVDDGYNSADKVGLYARLQESGHSVSWLAFDSGFGEKANEALKYLDKQYVLIGSDDFEFDATARAGVEKMLTVMEACPELGVVSGRVDGNPYESVFQKQPGVIREIRKYHGTGEVGGVKYHTCDLTVNYSLIRRKLFEEPSSIRWDGGEVKIGGGEHGAFFMDVQKAGWGVAVVPDANIRQFRYNSQWHTKDYPSKRARAKQGGLPCVKRRGVDKWVCQDGREEIC